MSAPREFENYIFPQASVMSLSWIPHCSSSSSSVSRRLTPQISAYSSQMLHIGSSMMADDTVNLSTQSSRKRDSNRRMSKTSYKHIPHKDKPPHLVARRNARERKRVQAVNTAFAKLRKCVPSENRNKRLSKVKTLHRAIDYINALQSLLRHSEDSSVLPSNPVLYSRHHSESNTSQEDDELDDDDRGVGEFNEFEEYLESDIEVVNKENERQGWTVATVSNYFYNLKNTI